MTGMTIKPALEIGDARGRCTHRVRVSKTETGQKQRSAYARRKIGVPEDQCGRRSDFIVDGARMCRGHAGAAALEHLLEASRPRTNEEEIANPRCRCPTARVRHVIIEHGTCPMAGCPYGGDV